MQGGLTPKKVQQQHEAIDQLNHQLAPFKIFKGIEADILGNGHLDYTETILESFDFIIASIHSGLEMDKKRATERLLQAIKNPFTTILGHPTGRLLLRRAGYPIDHEAILDACVEHQVIVEINAHPSRLDWDWRWIHAGIQKGVIFSINPDAHTKEGYQDMFYGICMGRKGALTQAGWRFL